MNINKVVFGDQVLIDLTLNTAKPEHILEGMGTLNSEGDYITGSMPLIEPTAGQYVITYKSANIPIPEGYHDGTEAVTVNMAVQDKTVTPTSVSQMVTVDPGYYEYLNSVIVDPIPFSQEENEAGGYTVFIG